MKKHEKHILILDLKSGYADKVFEYVRNYLSRSEVKLIQLDDNSKLNIEDSSFLTEYSWLIFIATDEVNESTLKVVEQIRKLDNLDWLPILIFCTEAKEDSILDAYNQYVNAVIPLQNADVDKELCAVMDFWIGTVRFPPETEF